MFQDKTTWRRLLAAWIGDAPLSGVKRESACNGSTPTIVDRRFQYGSGPNAVILIHGLTGTPVEMQIVGRRLAARGFAVYGIQLAGHCGSEAELLATGWKDWYRSVEEAYHDVARRHEHVFAAGLSMGALMSIHLAAAHPAKLRGIGLYSPTLFYDGWAVPKFAALLPLVLRTPIGRRYRFVENFPYGIKDERLRELVVKSMTSGQSDLAGNLGMHGESLMELRRFIAIVKRDMASVQVPSLVLQARDDDITSPKNAAYLAARLGGAVRVEYLDDCYHMITIDRQREEVVRLSDDFFRACVTPADSAASEASQSYVMNRELFSVSDA